MAAYYNEFDEYAAQWLRNLIAAGHIADGDVDQRSINDVSADDLANYTQCHFFAGIGVWSHALRLAGWDDDRPVWTGSCPCQPFSTAGEGNGSADERHLWPRFFELIAERKPAVVFGEQVEAAIKHGWLDLVQSDMEGIGYAFAAAGIPAAGVGAPHIRQRLYFVADSAGIRLNEQRGASRFALQGQRAERVGKHAEPQLSGELSRGFEGLGGVGGMDDAYAGRSPGGYGSTTGENLGERVSASAGSGCLVDDPLGLGCGARRNDDRPSPTNGHWRDADWLFCRDGKLRPVEPGYEQMVDGSARSLGRVRTDSIAKIEEEINAWSFRHKADAGEVLRRLWQALSAEAISERQVGRFSGVQSPPVLLAFMRQLSEQGWRFTDAMPCCGEDAPKVVLRIMRFDREAACAPLRRELAEQFGGELADALRELSQIVARNAAECWGISCREKAGAASFPLAVGASSRVGRLRAYGNAIVPQVAQAFIEAFLEVRP